MMGHKNVHFKTILIKKNATWCWKWAPPVTVMTFIRFVTCANTVLSLDKNISLYSLSHRPLRKCEIPGSCILNYKWGRKCEIPVPTNIDKEQRWQIMRGSMIRIVDIPWQTEVMHMSAQLAISTGGLKKVNEIPSHITKLSPLQCYDLKWVERANIKTHR